MAMFKSSVRNDPASNHKPVPGKASILPLREPGSFAKKIVPLVEPTK